jgi:hypothetical protein
MQERPAEPTYSLKLDMLLVTLQAHRQTCELFAVVPAGTLPAPGGRRERAKLQVPCLVELSVREGQVYTCLLRGHESGRVIAQGGAALDLLRSCEALSWSVREPQTSTAPPGPVASLDGHLSWSQRAGTKPRPARSAFGLTGGQLASLPRKHRQVLLLLNGERGMEELCRILHCEPAQLTAILDDLAARHLITFNPADGTAVEDERFLR